MEVYSVYLGGIFLKSFKSLRDAFILFTGLQIFLITQDMDIDMVNITKEVL